MGTVIAVAAFMYLPGRLPHRWNPLCREHCFRKRNTRINRRARGNVGFGLAAALAMTVAHARRHQRMLGLAPRRSLRAVGVVAVAFSVGVLAVASTHVAVSPVIANNTVVPRGGARCSSWQSSRVCWHGRSVVAG